MTHTARRRALGIGWLATLPATLWGLALHQTVRFVATEAVRTQRLAGRARISLALIDRTACPALGGVMTLQSTALVQAALTDWRQAVGCTDGRADRVVALEAAQQMTAF